MITQRCLFSSQLKTKQKKISFREKMGEEKKIHKGQSSQRPLLFVIEKDVISST